MEFLPYPTLAQLFCSKNGMQGWSARHCFDIKSLIGAKFIFMSRPTKAVLWLAVADVLVVLIMCGFSFIDLLAAPDMTIERQVSQDGKWIVEVHSESSSKFADLPPTIEVWLVPILQQKSVFTNFNDVSVLVYSRTNTCAPAGAFGANWVHADRLAVTIPACSTTQHRAEGGDEEFVRMTNVKGIAIQYEASGTSKALQH